jgi:hypothetical protein
MRKKFGLVVLLGATAAGLWAACTKPTAPGGILLTGLWGSDQSRLTATQVSTQFSGACGSGNTNEPIMLDKHGRFDMVGVYSANGTLSSPARFKGSISSKKLTLRVMRADSSHALGPIELDLGQQPALATCR